MTTPVGHSIFAMAVFGIWGVIRKSQNLLFLLFLLLASFLPDLDYFPLFWGDLHLANLNHQGFTHSILFIVFSCLALAIFAKWFRQGEIKVTYPFLLAAGFSHLLLDYLTFDGREPIGIPLFWPLDLRFNSPVTLFGGVAKGSLSDLLSLHNLYVVGGEILLLGIPALLLWLLSTKFIQKPAHLPDNE